MRADRKRDYGRVQGFPMFCIAAASLILGHAATYLLVYREQHEREVVLAGTGHGYLSAFAHAAFFLGAAAVVSLMVPRWSSRYRVSMRSFASLVATLALVQVCAFVGQEILERAVSGAPLGELVGCPLLVIGVGVQIVLALVGGGLALCILRTSVRLGSATHGRTKMWRPTAVLALSIAVQVWVDSGATGARPGRSPPLPA